MQLDTNIPFRALATVPLMSPQEHQQNALARQMQQLQLQNAQYDIQGKQRARENESALAKAFQDPSIRGADGSLDYNALSKQVQAFDPQRAIEYEAQGVKQTRDRSEFERKQRMDALKMEKDEVDIVSQLLPAAYDQGTWTATRVKLQSLGVDVTDMPEQYDPQYAKYAAEQALTAKEKLDHQFNREKFEFQKLDAAEDRKLVRRGRSSGGGGGSYPQAPVQLIPAPAGGQPPDGQPQEPVTRRITAPPKGMKLPVGMAWDPDNKMAVPIPGVATKSGGSGKPMPKGFKLPSGYMWDPAAGGVTPAAGSPAAQKSAAAKKSTADAVAKGKYAVSVIDKALTHPGRRTATGLSSVFDPRNVIPGTKSKDFQIVMDQIGGQAFLQAFETLKGGGAISEKEGKRATDAIARLNRYQSDAEFKASLHELKQIVNDGLSRTKVAPIDGAKFLGFE